MLIGGLDIGTSGCKFILYDEKGTFQYRAYEEYDVTRQLGKSEIDPDTIWRSVCHVIKEAVREKGSPKAIGVTSFGESFVLLDQEDEVIMPSMMYTDPRGAEQCDQIVAAIGEEAMIKAVGVKPHCMYSLPKIMWIRDNHPDAYKRTRKILLYQDFVVYRLSGKAQIDYSLATRTMAFDIRSKCWKAEILQAAGIPVTYFSKPVPPGTVAGKVKSTIAAELGLSEDVLIVTGAHDQPASALGAGAFDPGAAVDGTGTVECITPVFNEIPSNPKLYEAGFPVIPYVFDGTYVCYAVSFTGGAALKWYRDNFAKFEADLARREGKNTYQFLDSKVRPQPTGLLILPHFTGGGNPYMDNNSTGAILGLTLETSGYDIYKALMEGITYEMRLNMEYLEQMGICPDAITTTGGGANSPVWLQIKADILNKKIIACEAEEVGAMGTCMLAGVGAGILPDLKSAAALFVRKGHVYEPSPDNHALYTKYYKRYKKVYSAVKDVFQDKYTDKEEK